MRFTLRVAAKIGALLLLIVASIGSQEVSAKKNDTKPNIVFIVADDLGFNDVGYHNHKDAYTPMIDELAKGGVILENHYVQPICAPTRTQLISGRSQIHTGLQHKNIVITKPTGLPLDSATLPDKLKEAGYATDMVGKWHLGFYHQDYLPTSRGFDTSYGLYTGGSDHYKHTACAKTHDCAFDLHNDTSTERRDDREQEGFFSTELFTQEASRIIKHRAKEENPFFLYLAYTAVHTPIQAPEKYVDIIKKKMEERGQQLSQKREKFISMTYALDCGVRKVVETLKENGEWDNTILVFITDNGAAPSYGGSNKPLKGAKFSYFEGGVRGVAFANSPLFKKTGYVNNGMMHVTDWFPTFMHVANGNLEKTHDVNGFNQWETLSNGSPSPREEILFNIDPIIKYGSPVFYKHNSFDTRMLAAYRQGDYKIITGFSQAPGIQLYNVVEDPNEKTNLVMSNNPSYNTTADQMLERLQQIQQKAAPVYYPPTDPEFVLGASWQPWREMKLSPESQTLDVGAGYGPASQEPVWLSGKSAHMSQDMEPRK